MRYRPLGRTGFYVSELSFGTMTFAGEGFWQAIGRVDLKNAEALLARAIEAGVNLIDTADVYSQGGSEKILGAALKNIGVPRKDVAIATKFFSRVGNGPNDAGGSRGHIMDAVDASLKRLETDYIDLYQIHSFDSLTPMDETLRALDDLVSSGRVRYIGCSNWAGWQIVKAMGLSERRGFARYVSSQSFYSIAVRDIEADLVPALDDQGLGLLVWSPLAGGLLSGKFGPGATEDAGARRVNFDFPPVDRDHAWKIVAVMRDIAQKLGVSVARVALAWLLTKPFVTSVILGAKRLDQLDDNLAAADLVLPADALEALDAVSQPPPRYPGWMHDFMDRMRAPDAKVM